MSITLLLLLLLQMKGNHSEKKLDTWSVVVAGQDSYKQG